MIKSNIYIYLVFLCAIAFFSSCSSSKKVMYNPAEVAFLSEKLKIPIDNDEPKMGLLAESSLWLGVPYKYGGSSKSGTDCSGFVWQVFERVYGKKLERASYQMAEKNVQKISKGALRTGDLVFFKTSKKSKKINHVGIYLKNGYFVHSSTSKGVIVSNLDEAYYKNAWVKGGRIK